MAGGSAERRRIAIDVAGYSRLMGPDEEGTLAALMGHRAAADPIGARHGGRIVGCPGDGLPVVFPSVVEAVIVLSPLLITGTLLVAGIVSWRQGTYAGVLSVIIVFVGAMIAASWHKRRVTRPQRESVPITGEPISEVRLCAAP